MGSKLSSLPSTDPDPGLDPPRDLGRQTANEEHQNQRISVEEELQYQQIIFEELQNQQISGEQELQYLQQIIYEGIRNQKISGEQQQQYLQQIIYEGLQNQKISGEEEIHNLVLEEVEKLRVEVAVREENEANEEGISRQLDAEREEGVDCDKRTENEYIYPVRPGAEECSLYMRTGTCKFGSNCKFNHPPRRKNQAAKENVKEKEESSERPGQTECKYYLRSGGSKHGKACRYNHSRGKTPVVPIVDVNFLDLPVRPGEKECPYYMRNGSCKYGSNCRFNHPDPTAEGEGDAPSGYSNGGSFSLQGASPSTMPPWSSPRAVNETAPFVPPSQGLPFPNGDQAPVYVAPHRRRLPTLEGEKECPYYMRNGSCKYGSNCRFNHPDPTAVGGDDAPFGYGNGGSFSSQGVSLSATPPWSPPRAVNETVPFVPPSQGLPSPNGDQAPVYVAPHRRRLPTLEEGEKECPYYMRNGSCKYGSNCRFNHPDPTAVGGDDALSGYGNGGSFSSQGVSLSATPPWSSPRAVNETVPFVPPSQGLPSPNGDQAPVYVAAHRRRLPTPPAFALNSAPETNCYMHHKQQMLVDEFPERPGQPHCTYYLKTGDCKYKSGCKYHHPKIQIPKTSTFALSDNGLLLRPDQNICSHYNHYGICKFGPACKFDHPVNYGPSATSTGPGPGTDTPPPFGNSATTDGARMGRVEI